MESECRARLERQEGICQTSGVSHRDGTELVLEAMGKEKDLQCAISPTVDRLSCVEEGTRQPGLTED